MNTGKLERAKSTDLVPCAISEKSKGASRKGKNVLRPIISISAKKTQQKTQNNAEMWNGPEKEAAKRKKDYSSKTLSVGKMGSVVKLSQ